MPFVGAKGEVHGPKHRFTARNLRSAAPANSDAAWWAISERAQQISHDVLQIRQGSTYPALHRLDRRGWIKARWGASGNNRRAKFYELTKAGREQLERQKHAWDELTRAVAPVLRTA